MLGVMAGVEGQSLAPFGSQNTSVAVPAIEDPKFGALIPAQRKHQALYLQMLSPRPIKPTVRRNKPEMGTLQHVATETHLTENK